MAARRRDGVKRIQLGNTVFEGENDVYLLDGETTALVDTGVALPDVRADLEEGLSEHGVGFADVDEVVLTHWHPDHAGLAGEIQAAGGADVYVHEADASLVDGTETPLFADRDLQRETFERWAAETEGEASAAFATAAGRPASGDVPIGEMNLERRRAREEHVDFSAPVRGGPTDRGFDYYFGDDVPNFPPYTWIENGRVVEEPTVEKPDDMFGHPGPMAPGWTLESVMPEITARAVDYVEERGESDDADPFFLYFPLTAPHTPIVPTKRFRGQSDAGEYGDWVCEVNWAVGQVLDALVEVASEDGKEEATQRARWVPGA
jgi:hypothetical protein